jgi:hypothetical protein
MKETLKDIFSNVNDWLKFAEEKNAALIALNIVSIFGTAATLTQNDVPIPKYILYYLYSFIICNGLGLCIALYSFWPQTLNEDVFRKKIGDFFLTNSEPGDSVLFYGHIKDYTPEFYLAKLRKSCSKEEGEYYDLELEYANEIIINSRITSRKYNYFKIALFFTLLGILTPMIFIIRALSSKVINYLIKE